MFAPNLAKLIKYFHRFHHKAYIAYVGRLWSVVVVENIPCFKFTKMYIYAILQISLVFRTLRSMIVDIDGSY